MEHVSRPRGALSAYERTAPFYDAFTAHHDYERWLPRLVYLARGHGLKGRRLLDVGCGTGKSFMPLLRSGWQVTACDLSPAMLRRARSKAAGRARFEVADMQHLPRLGSFDLVWSIDDAVNYMLGPEELESCLRGLRRNLGHGGLVLFDLNTLRTYRTFYSETEIQCQGKWRLVWRGHGDPDLAPGSTVAATFEAWRAGQGQRGVAPITATHRQRHFSSGEVRTALEAAGLECLAALGQGLDGYAEHPLDEERHTKAIFIAKRRERR